MDLFFFFFTLASTGTVGTTSDGGEAACASTSENVVEGAGQNLSVGDRSRNDDGVTSGNAAVDDGLGVDDELEEVAAAERG